MKKMFKFIALVAALAMVLSLAACVLKGNLKLESFTVDRSSVKTDYLIGEEIDFSGIQATAKYSDESLNKVYTFNELTITYAEDITDTVGEKEVKVSFMDPNLNVKQETVVVIKVSSEIIPEVPELSIAVQFEKPDSLVSFDSANNVNTELKYGDSGFAGEFAVGGKTYTVGNENAFRFIPKLAILNDDDTIAAVENFFAVVEMSVLTDDGYVALTATAGEGNLVSYYNGETLIATVDTYKGLYNFTEDAEGLTVKISVLPSEEHYIFEAFNPVVLEVEIIKAYNVYEAWELAVIDNDNTDGREEDWDAHAWDAFKTEKGIANVTASGIVLHADINITVDDVPAVFFMTTDKDVVYTNATTGETTTIPAGTKYLKDWSMIYRRWMAADETFVMEGNFFSISVSQFPIIASPAVFGVEGVGDDYGSDFSNATLFQFLNDNDTAADHYPIVTLQNLSIIGNAARNNTVDADGNLVSAGGLIFLKSTYQVTANFDNMLGNSFFITYFVDQDSIMNVSNVKCYDSYQNAIYMWANSKLTIVDSFFNGAGGPMAIVASPEIDGTYTYPQMTATNTVFESHVSGEEVWFNAIGGTTIVGQMKALSNGLKAGGLGSFVDDAGKMNIQGLLMPEGSNANEVLMGVNAQGSLFIDGKGMNRNMTDEHWLSILGTVQTLGAMPPFLTVHDAQGNAYTLFSPDGQNLCDLSGAAFNPYGNQEHAIIAGVFMQADTFVLTQGGISVILEFYH